MESEVVGSWVNRQQFAEVYSHAVNAHPHGFLTIRLKSHDKDNLGVCAGFFQVVGAIVASWLSASQLPLRPLPAEMSAAPPLPWSLVDEFDLPLVDGKHAFPAQCVATEGPRPQALGGFSITY